MATTAERSHRINGEINVPEIRLIGVENEQIGVVKTFEALKMAQDADVDLVEISPTAVPPVAKLMDYGKFKYSEQKKAHEAKLKQKVIEVKETVFRPQTDEHDYQVKLRKMREFLEEGDKCKVRMRFRGREMAHQEFGMQLLERVKNDLAELSTIEAHPKMEGRQMIMVLAPKKKK